ncbi:MAG: hypothetical protein RRZ84_07975 [Romboutsia sp.]
MIRQNIIKCKIYGINKVLITCNCNNIGSKKAIIANGVVFERYVEVDGDTIERYWIQL